MVGTLRFAHPTKRSGFVGWVERSETHRPRKRWVSLALYPPYDSSWISRRLLRGPATVDGVVRAGDLGGIVAAKEQRKRCDLVRGDELLGRLGRQQHVLDDLLL